VPGAHPNDAWSRTLTIKALALGLQRAQRFSHCLGEPVVADVLQGWPGRSRRADCPDSQIEVGQFVDDLGRAPRGG